MGVVPERIAPAMFKPGVERLSLRRLSALNGTADSQLGQAEDLVAARNRLKGEKSVADAATLPAIGAALRVREASLVTNLLRHEGAEQGGRKPFRY
jgi:hypothetical protein